MKTILLMAALALVGCKKKTETSAAEGPSCADAIAKAVGAMPGGPGGGTVQAQLKELMTRRCTEDKWPAEVVSCYATQVTDMASMKTCREKLPQDKQTALMTEIRGVMMGASGAGGGPMHGAPSAHPAAAGSAAPGSAAPGSAAAGSAAAGSAAAGSAAPGSAAAPQ
jgi:hypothetical protein